MPNQGYGGKGKLNMNMNNKHVAQFVNQSKPSTGNKTKSTSLVYKVASPGTKDGQVMIKMIEKSKLKGYEWGLLF